MIKVGIQEETCLGVWKEDNGSGHGLQVSAMQRGPSRAWGAEGVGRSELFWGRCR